MPAADLSLIPPFYHNYVRQVQEDNVHAAVDNHIISLAAMLRQLSEEDWNYAYAPGKWTMKELVQHITDTERIFSYRALCIARQDQNALPGFDEGSYAANSRANERSGASILEELMAIDHATRCLFRSFGQQQLANVGVANGLQVTVNGIGFILAGHAHHHACIIRERYLDKAYVHGDIS